MNILNAIATFFDFRTKNEKEKDQRRQVRQAQRAVERSAELVLEKITEQKKNRDAAWKEASVYLKNGQQMQAKRSLQTVKMIESQINQLDKKYWVTNLYAAKLDMALVDKNLTASLGTLCKEIEIDSNQIEDIFSDISGKLGDQALIDKIWNKEHNKSMEGLDSDEDLQSIDDMMKSLTNEVAMDINGVNINELTTTPKSEHSILKEIEQGQKDLQETISKNR